MGEVGAGKSSLVEKLTGLTQLSSDLPESVTVAMKSFTSSDRRLHIVDTPGNNAPEEARAHSSSCLRHDAEARHQGAPCA